ncbi:hypothetical protein OBBRIDRAFT_505717 [Obba rivulosa]|uniref:Secreted protein n=1 Tax=Obba rivulosa TaxID=1052685 RepID=A0A8E2DNW4_9APHY|nr:hypothetical protein OBBRIDRAFT_505717 [Obba rivulosa]
MVLIHWNIIFVLACSASQEKRQRAISGVFEWRRSPQIYHRVILTCMMKRKRDSVRELLDVNDRLRNREGLMFYVVYVTLAASCSDQYVRAQFL